MGGAFLENPGDENAPPALRDAAIRRGATRPRSEASVCALTVPEGEDCSQGF